MFYPSGGKQSTCLSINILTKYPLLRKWPGESKHQLVSQSIFCQKAMNAFPLWEPTMCERMCKKCDDGIRCKGRPMQRLLLPLMEKYCARKFHTVHSRSHHPSIFSLFCGTTFFAFDASWCNFAAASPHQSTSRSNTFPFLFPEIKNQLCQGVDSDEDDDHGEAEEEDDGQFLDEEEYQLELAHGYVKKGEKPKWETFATSIYGDKKTYLSAEVDVLGWSWRVGTCSRWTPTCRTSPASPGTAPSTRWTAVPPPLSPGTWWWTFFLKLLQKGDFCWG